MPASHAGHLQTAQARPTAAHETLPSSAAIGIARRLGAARAGDGAFHRSFLIADGMSLLGSSIRIRDEGVPRAKVKAFEPGRVVRSFGLAALDLPTMETPI